MKFKLKHIIGVFIVFCLQVFVFNSLHFSYWIHPLVYPLLLLVLPINLKGYQLLLIAFALGFLMDMFIGTYGLHTFSSVLLAGLKPFFLNLLNLNRLEEQQNLSLKQNGFVSILLLFTLLLIPHHISFFLLEAFASSGILNALLQAIVSVVFSVVFAMMLFVLFFNPTKNER